jgi:hypothetical protein
LFSALIVKSNTGASRHFEQDAEPTPLNLNKFVPAPPKYAEVRPPTLAEQLSSEEAKFNLFGFDVADKITNPVKSTPPGLAMNTAGDVIQTRKPTTVTSHKQASSLVNSKFATLPKVSPPSPWVKKPIRSGSDESLPAPGDDEIIPDPGRPSWMLQKYRPKVSVTTVKSPLKRDSSADQNPSGPSDAGPQRVETPFKYGSLSLIKTAVEKKKQLTYNHVSRLQGGGATYHQMLRKAPVRSIPHDYVVTQRVDTITEMIDGNPVQTRKEARNLKISGELYRYYHSATHCKVNRNIPLEVF